MTDTRERVMTGAQTGCLVVPEFVEFLEPGDFEALLRTGVTATPFRTTCTLTAPNPRAGEDGAATHLWTRDQDLWDRVRAGEFG